MHPLQERRAALDSQTGVDVLLRQGREPAVLVEVELHEDEVPELEVAVAFAARSAVVASAAVLVTAVEVELRAGAARPRRARLPEVLGPRQAADAVGRYPDALPAGDGHAVLAEPELRVAREHGRPQALGGKAHVPRHELPGEVDRPVLEVVAHREVAEHLEEREMASSQPDCVDIGRTKAFLDCGQPVRGRFLLAEEVRLQGLHAGRRQEDRGVVCTGHERP